jgi:hypothetical protein
MSDHTFDRIHPPSVSVVGLGVAGAETVDAIATDTSATLTTVDPDEADPAVASVADADFLYLAGDVSEPGVVDAAGTLLDATPGHATAVVEGTTDRPAPVAEGCDLLLPVDPDAVPTPDGRSLVASAIADCFEAMLSPTIQNLGYGDVLLATGAGADDGRIGALHVAALGGLRHAVTDRVDVTDPDGVLYFLCTDERLQPIVASRRGADVSEEFPDASCLLWEQRVHDRYGDPAHAKLLTTVDADADRRARLLRP